MSNGIKLMADNRRDIQAQRPMMPEVDGVRLVILYGINSENGRETFAHLRSIGEQPVSYHQLRMQNLPEAETRGSLPTLTRYKLYRLAASQGYTTLTWCFGPDHPDAIALRRALDRVPLASTAPIRANDR